MKDTFKFGVNCGNYTSNNTETRSSTSDATSSRKGRAECATAGIATSNLTLISSKPVPSLNTFMNNEKEERKSLFKKNSKKTKRMLPSTLASCDKLKRKICSSPNEEKLVL